MFMRNNRAKNGAPQPEAVERADAPSQEAQETLSPNPTGLGEGQKRTFQPNLETPEAIDRRRMRGGIDESEWPDYEKSVPCGPSMP